MPSVSRQPASVLKSVFGYDTFRPYQEECIRAVLDKKDVLLVMPTGGGKSLCYQIPALIFDGLTVVVSPLISLMQDQVAQLKALGVRADVLNSSLSAKDYERNWKRVEKGTTRLLFVAPETLLKKDILALLERVNVACLTVDEAHCISEWGHDFRPDYRLLKTVREKLPGTVCLAMTATATPRVREDILRNLDIPDAIELIASFNRPNLFYEIVPKMNPFRQTLDVLERFPNQSGIIYCFSRKQVDELALQIKSAGYSVLPYHAGLKKMDRYKNQTKFIRDDVRIMVATVAFGMGINKPNVRFVIHYDLPRNIESYYQETGRAGRDDLPATCVLLFSRADNAKIKFLIDQKKDEREKRAAQWHLNSLVNYANSKECRRLSLIRYFGEDYNIERCDRCDNCVRPKDQVFDLMPLARKFLTCVMHTRESFSGPHIIDILTGRRTDEVIRHRHDRIDSFGSGKDFSTEQWQYLFRQFLEQELVEMDLDEGVLRLTPRYLEMAASRDKLPGQPPPDVVKIEEPPPRVAEALSECDQELLDMLVALRKDIADREDVPPYVIFPDRSLHEMAAMKPGTRLAFSNMFGVTTKKLNDYGDMFIQKINAYRFQKVQKAGLS